MHLMEATKSYKSLAWFTFDLKPEFEGNHNKTIYTLIHKSSSDKDNVIMNIEQRSSVSSFAIAAS